MRLRPEHIEVLKSMQEGWTLGWYGKRTKKTGGWLRKTQYASEPVSVAVMKYLIKNKLVERSIRRYMFYELKLTNKGIEKLKSL